MTKYLRFSVLCGVILLAGVAVGQDPVTTAKGTTTKTTTTTKVVNGMKPISVVVGSDAVVFEGAQPQTILGRIMVPLRGVFEKIGAYVEYDAATHIITAHYQNQSVVITMGKRLANVNGAEIMMEVPATILGGHALVPLRFLAESIGAKVDFDQPTNTVTITSNDMSFGDKKGGGGTTGGSSDRR